MNRDYTETVVQLNDDQLILSTFVLQLSDSHSCGG